tara:strand:- start:145 stop:465 length:321 start_codon:yes stop_codon:yes gene_type:complete
MLYGLRRIKWNKDTKKEENGVIHSECAARVDRYDSVIIEHDTDTEYLVNETTGCAHMTETQRQELSDKCFLLQKGLKLADAGNPNKNFGYAENKKAVTYYKILPIQ